MGGFCFYIIFIIRKLFMAKENKTTTTGKITDGTKCKVIGGTHIGKSGVIKDINTSKTGHLTITVVQKDGVRFKTLAKNVEVI
jgi:ribosomal protein S4E